MLRAVAVQVLGMTPTEALFFGLHSLRIAGFNRGARVKKDGAALMDIGDWAQMANFRPFAHGSLSEKYAMVRPMVDY